MSKLILFIAVALAGAANAQLLIPDRATLEREIAIERRYLAELRADLRTNEQSIAGARAEVAKVKGDPRAKDLLQVLESIVQDLIEYNAELYEQLRIEANKLAALEKRRGEFSK